jgi:hypothetical protein
MKLGADIRLSLEVYCIYLRIIWFIGNSIGQEQYLGVYSNIKGAATIIGPRLEIEQAI